MNGAHTSPFYHQRSIILFEQRRKRARQNNAGSRRENRAERREKRKEKKRRKEKGRKREERRSTPRIQAGDGWIVGRLAVEAALLPKSLPVTAVVET